MKQIAMGVALAALLLGTASASSLRMGGELIREGTPATTVLRVLGQPELRTVVYECPNGCAPDYELWSYRVKNLNYDFGVRGGKVISVDWSRF